MLAEDVWDVSCKNITQHSAAAAGNAAHEHHKEDVVGEQGVSINNGDHGEAAETHGIENLQENIAGGNRHRAVASLDKIGNTNTDPYQSDKEKPETSFLGQKRER